MFSFDTPPVNRSCSSLTLFFVFSSASWPLFLRFHELSLSISLLSRASAREVRPGLPFCSFLAPLTPLERSKGSKQYKNQRFFNISKIAPRPSGATSGRPKGLPRGPFWIGCTAQGDLGMPEFPDRAPWAAKWDPGGGEQGLWRNQARIYSGQGFQKKKTFPVRATDTFFQELHYFA